MRAGFATSAAQAAMGEIRIARQTLARIFVAPVPLRPQRRLVLGEFIPRNRTIAHIARVYR